MRTPLILLAVAVANSVLAELPEDTAILISRMEAFAASARAETEKKIAEKQREVDAALAEHLDRETRAGNLDGALAIRALIGSPQESIAAAAGSWVFRAAHPNREIYSHMQALPKSQSGRAWFAGGTTHRSDTAIFEYDRASSSWYVQMEGWGEKRDRSRCWKITEAADGSLTLYSPSTKTTLPVERIAPEEPGTIFSPMPVAEMTGFSREDLRSRSYGIVTGASLTDPVTVNLVLEGAGDNTGDGGMHVEIVDADGNVLLEKTKAAGTRWEREIPGIKTETIVVTFSDHDTAITGSKPGNGFSFRISEVESDGIAAPASSEKPSFFGVEVGR